MEMVMSDMIGAPDRQGHIWLVDGTCQDCGISEDRASEPCRMTASKIRKLLPHTGSIYDDDPPQREVQMPKTLERIRDLEAEVKGLQVSLLKEAVREVQRPVSQQTVLRASVAAHRAVLKWEAGDGRDTFLHTAIREAVKAAILPGRVLVENNDSVANGDKEVVSD